jgi:alpha-L-rhamnosidase
MKQKHTLFAFVLLLLMQLVNAQVKVSSLRCEMLANPLGIDVKEPRLNWEITSEQRNLQQTAYQIIVASTKEKLDRNEGDLWNSGKINSSQSIHVPYTGKKLLSRNECYWKVKAYTNKGETNWSTPAHWSMGLLDSADWKAKWIGLDSAFAWDSVSKFARLSARYFRKEFKAQKTIKKATVYIVGLGLYELYINGQRIGDQVLAPAPTDYSQSVKYNTFDVTDRLKEGTNTIGTILGNGRFFAMRQNYKPQKWHTFGFPKMLLQLELLYSDGTKSLIVTDKTWKITADGPIRTNNEYDGEEYDATKEMIGWNENGFNDKNWLPASLVKSPGGKIEAQMNPNMKIMEKLQPVSITQNSSGAYILDMGQNMAGWLQMKVQGKKGNKIILRYAETLQPNGSLYVANLRDAQVTDIYTIAGKEKEVWHPSFVYHGFRYVEITGYTGTPTINDFEGHVIYDEMSTIGSFETSNQTINSVFENSYWGIRSNYKGMPVDCPQRNERQPWLGDRATGSYGESFVFDNASLYAKWLDDIEQSQTAEGRIPDVAPSFWFYYKDNMTWPGAYLMIANMLYHQFGDKRPIVKHYASMKKWLAYMKSKYMTEDFIVTKDNYGDWCVPPESPELIHTKDPLSNTDGQVIATAYYYYFLQMMQHFAVIANKPEDIPAFASLAKNIKTGFNKKFFDKEKLQYSNGTVTANLLALSFGIVPDNYKHAIFQNIIDKTVNENGGHISTGVIGTQWLMRGLTKNGRPDVAYTIATKRDYPSWGYMVDNGATTIWELWNGNTADPSMNSGNHVMLLGDLIVWYYENLAGIKSDEAHPGFKQIIMNPSLVEGLNYVKASYQSVHGLIKSEWQKEATQLTWNISVPGNTNAIVYIPAADAKEVMENGTIASSVDGVKFIKMEDDKAVFSVGSGNYSFSVKANFKGLATKP